VTVEAKADRVKEAVAAGVSDYLVKPFDQETLRERLGSFCKGVRSEFNSAVCRCRNVMNPNVITIRADATVGEAIERVLEHGISGLPVVDDHDRLIGIITEFELVRAISRPSMKRQSVRKFISKNIVTVNEDTIHLEVVNLMEKHRIRRVPVVRNNYVVGIISRRDILRYVTENEDALREFLDTLRATAGAG